MSEIQKIRDKIILLVYLTCHGSSKNGQIGKKTVELQNSMLRIYNHAIVSYDGKKTFYTRSHGIKT